MDGRKRPSIGKIVAVVGAISAVVSLVLAIPKLVDWASAFISWIDGDKMIIVCAIIGATLAFVYTIPITVSGFRGKQAPKRDVKRYYRSARKIFVVGVVLVVMAFLSRHSKAGHKEMRSFMIEQDTAITQMHEDRVQEFIREITDKSVRQINNGSPSVAVRKVQENTRDNKYVFNKNEDNGKPPFYLVSGAYINKNSKDRNPLFLEPRERELIMACIGEAKGESGGGKSPSLEDIMMEVLECNELMDNLMLGYIYESKRLILGYDDKLAIIVGYVNWQMVPDSKK